MKQQWSSQELIDHWTLTQMEIALAQSISKTDYNQLGLHTPFCFYFFMRLVSLAVL